MGQSNPADAYVSIICPTCRARLNPRRELIGKRVRCPDCGVPVRVAQQATQAAAVSREVAAHEYSLSETETPREQPQTVLAVCGVCGARLFPRVELVGKRVRCPDCFKPVRVPAPPKDRPVKKERQVGQYRIDAEPAPNPLAAFIPTTPVDAPLSEPEPLPEAAPRWWFFSGIFTFPWSPGTVSRWMVLTILSLFSNGITAYGLSLMPDLAGASGPMAGYGVGIKVACTIAAGAIIWLMMMAYASGCVVAVIRDTASGNDEVTDWSDAEIYEGIWHIAYIVFPLLAAGAVGYGLYFVALMALPGDWPTARSTAELAGAVTALVLYPVMLVSALEQGSFWSVFSPTALRLIFGYLWGWLLVNIELALLTGGWWGLTALGMQWSPWPTVLLGAPWFAAVVLIDARLLGRFLYRANEVAGPEEEEADDRDEAERSEPLATGRS
jgi:DNA-directed RNA polymerase subunit RPC12/RpoP